MNPSLSLCDPGLMSLKCVGRQPRQLAARVLVAADAVPARVLLLVAHL